MGLLDAPSYHWTVEEYLRLGKAGFLQNVRVELLNGEIVLKAPQSPRHASMVSVLMTTFILRGNERYRVSSHCPLHLDEQSMPEPDICLLDNVTDELEAHPSVEHVYLAIEVSDSTLAFDRGSKRAAYATRKIPEYWIVNVQDKVLEVNRDPVGDRYRTTWSLGYGNDVTPLAFQDLTLRLSDLLAE